MAPTIGGCHFAVLSSSVQPCWLPCLSLPLHGSWASCSDPRKRGKPTCGTNLCRQADATREQTMHVSSWALLCFSLWRIHRTGWHWLERKCTKTLVDVKTLIGKDSGHLELLIHLGLLLLPLFRIQWTTQGLSLGDPNVQTHLTLSTVRARHSRVPLPSSVPHQWALGPGSLSRRGNATLSLKPSPH